MSDTKTKLAGERPKPTAGLRHIALFVDDLDASLHFYLDLMGMSVEWQPDPDNVYLTSGNDNLALHRLPEDQRDAAKAKNARLDHIGFIIDDIDEVERWYAFLTANDVEMCSSVKKHRDGACSFYCKDPNGIVVQIIYHPPLSALK